MGSTEVDYSRLLDRFSRQILVPEIGVKGLEALRGARVAIVGCGATGTFISEYLVRMGVGYLRVIDGDFVEESNLTRVVMFTEDDIFTPKASTCRRHLESISSFTRVDSFVDRLRPSNVEELLTGVELVVDASDNMETRFLINDFSIKHGIPWVYVGVERWYGMVVPILPRKTPCLCCILGRRWVERARRGGVDRGDRCSILGVTITAVALTSAVAVNYVYKIISGDNIEPQIIVINALSNEIEKVSVKKLEECECCVKNNYVYLGREEELVMEICGSNQVEVKPPRKLAIDLGMLSSIREFRVLKTTSEVAVVDFRGYRLAVFSDGRAIVMNETNLEKAEKLYNEFMKYAKRAIID